MNPLLRTFSRHMWLAAERGGLRKGELVKKYDIKSFELDEVGELDTADVIAAKALRYFCVEDGRFNNFRVGIVGIIGFLEESMKPADWWAARRAQAYQDLRNILDQGAHYQAILAWVHSWYG